MDFSAKKRPFLWRNYLLLYLLFSLVFILQVIFWIPFVFIRWLVIVLVKFRSDTNQIGNMLDTWETLLADDDFNNNTSNFTLVKVLALNGILTVQNLRKSVLGALSLNYDQSKYP